MSESQQQSSPPSERGRGRGRRGRRGRGGAQRRDEDGRKSRRQDNNERPERSFVQTPKGVLGVDGKVRQSNRRRKEKSDRTLDERKEFVAPAADEKDDDESIKAFIENHVPEVQLTADQVHKVNEEKSAHEILLVRGKTLNAYSAFPTLGLVKPNGEVNPDFDKRKVTISIPIEMTIHKNYGDVPSGEPIFARVFNREIQHAVHEELVKRSKMEGFKGAVWAVNAKDIRHLFVCEIRLGRALNCTGTDMTVLPVSLVPRPFNEGLHKMLLKNDADEYARLTAMFGVFFDSSFPRGYKTFRDAAAFYGHLAEAADKPHSRLLRRVRTLNQRYAFDADQNGENVFMSWGAAKGERLYEEEVVAQSRSINVWADDAFVPIGASRTRGKDKTTTFDYQRRRWVPSALYGKKALDALGHKVITRQRTRHTREEEEKAADDEKEQPVTGLDNVIRSHGEDAFDCRIFTAGHDALDFGDDDASKRERFDRNIFMNPLLELVRTLFGGGLGNYGRSEASFKEWLKLPSTGDNRRKVFLDLPNDKDHTWPTHLSYAVARSRRNRRDNYIEERRKELEKEYDEELEKEKDERRQARIIKEIDRDIANGVMGVSVAAGIYGPERERLERAADAEFKKEQKAERKKMILKSEKLINKLAKKAITQYLAAHPDKTPKSLTPDDKKDIVKSFLQDEELTTSLRKFTFATEEDLKPEHYGPSVKNKMKISYKQLLALLATMNDAFPNAELVLQLNSPGKDASDFALLFAPKAPLPNMTVERTLSLEVEMTVIPAM
jgi:hypothetical protein